MYFRKGPGGGGKGVLSGKLGQGCFGEGKGMFTSLILII